MRDGIANRIDPGDPHEVDDFPIRSRRASRCSRGRSARRSTRSSRTTWCASALPGDLYDTFVAIKRDEWHRACGAVTEWDRETYLTYIP